MILTLPRLAKDELDYYRKCCKNAQEDMAEFGKLSLNIRTVIYCSYNGGTHFGWDFAQQVHYPSNPEQPGPIYFKTPRKCAVFGVCNDGGNIQYNYLIDG